MRRQRHGSFFCFAVSWFLVLDRTCGWWSKFVKIFGSFGAPLKVETSAGFLECFWCAIIQVESWTFDSLQIGASAKEPKAYP